MRNGRKRFYVRPSGGSYGTADGLTYATAWNGFSNIDWSLVANNTLAICGTHNEAITVGASNCKIVGNDPNESGTIDGQNTRVTGLTVDGYNNLRVFNLTVSNHTTQNVYNGNTTGTSYTSCTFGASGNQCVQNEDATCVVTYNSCTFDSGTDDGVSLHLNSIVTLNNCTISNCAEGINGISTSTLIANNCTFTSNTTDLKADSDSDFTVNNSFISSNISCGSSVNIKLNNCLLTGGITTVLTSGGLEVEECRFENTSQIISNQTDVSRVSINRSYFEVAVTSKIYAQNNGCYDVKYCIFNINTGTNIYAFRQAAQTNRSTVENCTIIGSSNTGRGVTGIGVDFKNCIFNDMNLAANPNGAGSITFDYCNVFNVTTLNINQNGGSLTETNAVSGDPVLADVSNLDFNLGVGSSCIGSGDTLTDSTAIDSASWGNGTNQIPSVTTGEQSASWNIGAYV